MIDLGREEIIKDNSEASGFCGWMKYSNSNTGKKRRSLVGNILRKFLKFVGAFFICPKEKNKVDTLVKLGAGCMSLELRVYLHWTLMESQG